MDSPMKVEITNHPKVSGLVTQKWFGLFLVMTMLAVLVACIKYIFVG
jgi:hypothetical protein